MRCVVVPQMPLTAMIVLSMTRNRFLVTSSDETLRSIEACLKFSGAVWRSRQFIPTDTFPQSATNSSSIFCPEPRAAAEMRGRWQRWWLTSSPDGTSTPFWRDKSQQSSGKHWEAKPLTPVKRGNSDRVVPLGLAREH